MEGAGPDPGTQDRCRKTPRARTEVRALDPNYVLMSRNVPSAKFTRIVYPLSATLFLKSKRKMASPVSNVPPIQSGSVSSKSADVGAAVPSQMMSLVRPYVSHTLVRSPLLSGHSTETSAISLASPVEFVSRTVRRFPLVCSRSRVIPGVIVTVASSDTVSVPNESSPVAVAVLGTSNGFTTLPQFLMNPLLLYRAIEKNAICQLTSTPSTGPAD